MRKGILALTLTAFVFALASGCAREEDLSDINETWVSAADELARDLDETRQSHQQLSERFRALQAAELDDPELITLRNELETTLEDHRSALDEVRGKLEESREERNRALEEGRRGDFQSAWSAAQTEYAAARAKLEELRSQHDALADGLERLEQAVAEPATETDPR